MKTFQCPSLRLRTVPVHGKCERAGSLTRRAHSVRDAYYLGIDFGTSGARICAVDGVFLTLCSPEFKYRSQLHVVYNGSCSYMCKHRRWRERVKHAVYITDHGDEVASGRAQYNRSDDANNLWTASWEQCASLRTIQFTYTPLCRIPGADITSRSAGLCLSCLARSQEM